MTHTRCKYNCTCLSLGFVRMSDHPFITTTLQAVGTGSIITKPCEDNGPRAKPIREMTQKMQNKGILLQAHHLQLMFLAGHVYS